MFRAQFLDISLFFFWLSLCFSLPKPSAPPGCTWRTAAAGTCCSAKHRAGSLDPPCTGQPTATPGGTYLTLPTPATSWTLKTSLWKWFPFCTTLLLTPPTPAWLKTTLLRLQATSKWQVEFTTTQRPQVRGKKRPCVGRGGFLQHCLPCVSEQFQSRKGPKSMVNPSLSLCPWDEEKGLCLVLLFQMVFMVRIAPSARGQNCQGMGRKEGRTHFRRTFSFEC